MLNMGSVTAEPWSDCYQVAARPSKRGDWEYGGMPYSTEVIGDWGTLLGRGRTRWRRACSTRQRGASLTPYHRRAN